MSELAGDRRIGNHRLSFRERTFFRGANDDTPTVISAPILGCRFAEFSSPSLNYFSEALAAVEFRRALTSDSINDCSSSSGMKPNGPRPPL